MWAFGADGKRERERESRVVDVVVAVPVTIRDGVVLLRVEEEKKAGERKNKGGNEILLTGRVCPSVCALSVVVMYVV